MGDNKPHSRLQFTISGDGDRTHDVKLGKLAFHSFTHRSHSGSACRIVKKPRPGLITLSDNRLQTCLCTGPLAGLNIGCHIIRHSSATEYLRLGGLLDLLSKIIGHTDISTTAIYTHLLTSDMVKSYDQFSPANALIV